jgi:hypothetical protein
LPILNHAHSQLWLTFFEEDFQEWEQGSSWQIWIFWWHPWQKVVDAKLFEMVSYIHIMKFNGDLVELVQTYLKGYAWTCWKKAEHESGKMHHYLCKEFNACVEGKFITKNYDNTFWSASFGTLQMLPIGPMTTYARMWRLKLNSYWRSTTCVGLSHIL